LEEMTSYRLNDGLEFAEFLAPQEIAKVYSHYEKTMRGERVPDR
jgi:hypothetical protein